MMLRNMLADRFKPVMHREKKEVSVLELMVSKGGPNLEQRRQSCKGCVANCSVDSSKSD